MLVLCLSLALFIAPLAVRFFPSWELFRQSRDSLRPEMEFGAVSYNEPSLVWYFRSRIHGWMRPLNASNASEFMEKPGPRFMVMPTDLATKTYPDLPPGWRTFSTRGLNIAKGTWVDLTLVLKPL